MQATVPAAAAAAAAKHGARPGGQLSELLSGVKRAADKADRGAASAAKQQQQQLLAAQQEQARRATKKRATAAHAQEVSELLLAERVEAVVTGAGLRAKLSPEGSDEDSGDDGKHGAQGSDEEENPDEVSEDSAEQRAAAAEKEARASRRMVSKLLGQLELCTHRIAALEKAQRDAAEMVALRAEQEEDTGEATEEGPPAGAAKAVDFPKASAARASAPASSSAPAVQMVMQIPMPARPATLVYASLDKTVETWCRQQRAWFKAARMESGEDQLMQAVSGMDAQLQEWWAMCTEAKEGAQSFGALERKLLSTFVRKDAVERAMAQLRDIRMLQSEDVHQYFIRVEDLRVKARVDDGDRVVLATVLDRVDQARWPIAYAQVAEEVRAGRITSISALRELLSIKVMSEPNLRLYRPPQQQSQAQSQGKNRLSALEAVAADPEAGAAPASLADLARLMAVMQARPQSTGPSCARCKRSGHWHQDCPEKDDRKCFRCNQSGHVRRNCPKGAQAKASAAAVSAPGAGAKQEADLSKNGPAR